MRQLVTLRVVKEIIPIKDADLIEEVVIDGWHLVCQKGIHTVGDQVLYFEIDSFLPASDERFESFMNFGITTFEGNKGHRVKTKRLRGVYSQGILMPVSSFPEVENPEFDVDYSETIGVVKWEQSEVEGSEGGSKSNFPDFIPKTSQDRIQNIYGKFSDENRKQEFVGTLKMNGSSITAYVRKDPVLNIPIYGICSRNVELELSSPDIPKNMRGKFEQGIINSGILQKLTDVYLNGYEMAFQGELVGPGIQGNYEKHDDYKVYMFNAFHITNQRYLTYGLFEAFCRKLKMDAVPVIYEATQILKSPLADILNLSEGKGMNAKHREGIVWKEVNGNTQFKAISNKFLDKYDQ